MKTVITIYISILICFVTNEKTFAQNFAPLNLGNIWVWEDEWGTIRKSTLVDTNYYFNNRYYSKIEYNIFGGYIYAFLNNTDSLFYYYDASYIYNNGDVPYYRLNCVLGDTFSFQLNPFAVFTKEVVEVYQAPVFDTTLAVKIIHWSAGGLVEGIEVWTDELGMLYKETGEGGGVEFRLRGCVINGRVYGDTSLTVGVEDEYFITHNFKLYQNYPNPFNPITTIEYELKEYSLVNLKVYDLLGNETAVLVNSNKEPGYHNVNFNASNLPSGVYVYTLQINGFTDSKKMLLLK